MRVSLIVAMAENRVIGLENRLPWHLPADLERFKKITWGHHLLMGRKTFDSIGRPLPGRVSVVISRGSPRLPENVRLAPSLEAAVDIAREAGDEEAFVIGGAEIFALALPIVDRIYLTRIHHTFAGDRFLPLWPDSEWALTQREDVPTGPDSHPFSYLLYDRISTATATKVPEE